jgi:hypothetical protein
MRIGILAAIVGVLGGAACGDGGGDGDGGGAAQQPESVSEPITAAEGGEVEAAGALLSIEGGALGDDLTIEVDAVEPDSELPDFASIRGLVYDFGPDGTTFDPPATLELPIEGKVPEGKEAVVSWLDGDTWIDLPSEVVAGMVSVEVEHFTMFVVRMRNVAASEIDCGFEACGGDLVGEWDIVGACANTSEEPGEEDPNPFEDCGGVLEVILDGSGGGTFKADGSFSASINVQPSVSYKLPPDCIEMLGAPATCAELGPMLDEIGGPTCTGDVDTECVCEGALDEAAEPIVAVGSFETSGDNLTTTTEGGGSQTVGYCVSGDTAKVVFADSILIFKAK